MKLLHCVGGVISPLLANIYLHEVLDVWFEREVKPRMKGGAELIRLCGRLCATKARKGGRDGRLKQPSCTRDEGRPLGLGLRGQGPNHRMLLRSNDRGGERDGKGGTNPSGVRWEGERE